jgi:hypothetical protein
VATAHAVDDYLFSLTGLLQPGTSHAYRRFLPSETEFMLDEPRRDLDCTGVRLRPQGAARPWSGGTAAHKVANVFPGRPTWTSDRLDSYNLTISSARAERTRLRRPCR